MTHRDEIRSKFFSTQTAVRLIALSSGFEVEVRQPTVGAQLDLIEQPDQKKRMLRVFVDNVFVPGTNEKVFEEGDYEAMMLIPASGDYQKIMTAMTELMDLNKATTDAAKNLGPTLA